MIKSSFGTIERKITIPIVLFSTLIALLATSVQIWVDYKKDVEEVAGRFKIIEQSHIRSLSEALWSMDVQQIKTIAAGIHSLPDVEFIAIAGDEIDSPIRLGNIISHNTQYKKFNILYQNGKDSYPVGTIEVVLTLDGAVQRSFSRFFLIISTNTLKALIVCLFIFYTVRKLITKHLKKISDYLKYEKPEGLLSLDRKLQTSEDDEIEVVVDSINKMQKDLQLHIDDIMKNKTELEKIVANKTKALQTAFEEKTSLLRIVCHDLANPLSIIAGNLQMLSHSHFSEPKKLERIKTIERSTELMADILNNVREMESLTSGKKELVLIPVDLKSVFDNIKFVFKEKLLAKDLTLILDNQVPPKVHCLADPVSLCHQVFNNLISNAIKFSFNHSTIEVCAKLEKQTIHVSVKDQGIGMSREHLSTVFDPHSQTTRSGTNGELGTGFGMPLVKTYVEKFGGHIQVESTSIDTDTEEHGSSFHIYLKSAS